jgi:hypothetical protein
VSDVELNRSGEEGGVVIEYCVWWVFLNMIGYMKVKERERRRRRKKDKKRKRMGCKAK